MMMIAALAVTALLRGGAPSFVDAPVRSHMAFSHCTADAAPEGAHPADNAGVVPPLPNGLALELQGLGHSRAGVGGRVWAAASRMCDFLQAEADSLRARTVLELGSGTGACGIYAAGLGAARVLLTDGGPPALIELLGHNVEANSQIFERAEVEVRELRWGEDTNERASAMAAGVDWVIGSDLTYDWEGNDELCVTLRALLDGAEGVGMKIVLCEEHGAPAPLNGSGSGYGLPFSRSGLFARKDAPLVTEDQTGGSRFIDEGLEDFSRIAADHGLSVTPFEPTPGEPPPSWRPVPHRSWQMADFMNGETFLMEVALQEDAAQQV